MKSNDLKSVASNLRRDVLSMTSAAGSGHPTSCMSCAEIVATLFFDEMVFDPKNPHDLRNDQFILSKGHAAPVLYASLKYAGCISDNLSSLRKINSNLEGHPVPRSLRWVKVATGSLGQGLGVGVGVAFGSKLRKSPSRTFVLLGDSELAEGSVFEALEVASHYELSNLVAIVDVNRLGQRGETLLGHGISDYKKRFSGFGWGVFTVDGHNVSELKDVLKKARSAKSPTIIFARTLKGKGVSFMEDVDGWHGKAANKEELEKALQEVPNIPLPKISISKPTGKVVVSKGSKLKLEREFVEEATRKVYGQTLASIAQSNPNVLAIDAEVSNSTYTKLVKDVCPDQFIEAFIAEQNMVSMATGLSTQGFSVFASSFAAFLSRAYDQVRMAAVSGVKMVLCGSHAGVSIGEDGASQMALEDLSMFRSLPGSVVVYPSDPVSAQALTVNALKNSGLTYIRTSRPKTQVLYDSKHSFPLGDFKVLRESKHDRAVLVGSGITVHEALKAYEVLKKRGVSVAVVDLYSVKPFNHAKFKRFVKSHGNHVVLAEDHHCEGGIGEMVSSGLVGSSVRFDHLFVSGVPHSGSKDELLSKYNIDSVSYVRRVK